MTTEIFEDMLGKTMSFVIRDTEDDGDRLVFCEPDGTRHIFLHHQDCCEYVRIEDICGDLEDLAGSPILQAEEATDCHADTADYDDSCTWTFYKFRTKKGSVTVRWLGESNGYYSEKVSYEVRKP